MIFTPLNDRDYVYVTSIGAVLVTDYKNISEYIDNVLVVANSLKVGNMAGTYTILIEVDGVPVQVPKRSDLFYTFETAPNNVRITKQSGDSSTTAITFYGVKQSLKQIGNRYGDNSN